MVLIICRLGCSAHSLRMLNLQLVAVGVVGKELAELKQLYDPKSYPYPDDLGLFSQWWWTLMRIYTDAVPGLGTCGVRSFARKLEAGGTPASFAYLFAHPTTSRNYSFMPGQGPGAVTVPHASEIQYVFNAGALLTPGTPTGMLLVVTTVEGKLYMECHCCDIRASGLGSRSPPYFPLYCSGCDDFWWYHILVVATRSGGGSCDASLSVLGQFCALWQPEHPGNTCGQVADVHHGRRPTAPARRGNRQGRGHRGSDRPPKGSLRPLGPKRPRALCRAAPFAVVMRDVGHSPPRSYSGPKASFK